MWTYEADKIENALEAAKNLFEEMRGDQRVEDTFGYDIDSVIDDLDEAMSELNDLDTMANEEEEHEDCVDVDEVRDAISDLENALSTLERQV